MRFGFNFDWRQRFRMNETAREATKTAYEAAQEAEREGRQFDGKKRARIALIAAFLRCLTEAARSRSLKPTCKPHRCGPCLARRRGSNRSNQMAARPRGECAHL